MDRIHPLTVRAESIVTSYDEAEGAFLVDMRMKKCAHSMRLLSPLLLAKLSGGTGAASSNAVFTAGAGTIQVQRLSFAAEPVSGTFDLTYDVSI